MAFENNSEEINVLHYISIILENKRIVFWCIVLGILFSLLVYFTKNDFSISLVNVYQAEATIEVGSFNQEYVFGSSRQPIDNIASLVT